jgi:hypothetical protein
MYVWPCAIQFRRFAWPVAVSPPVALLPSGTSSTVRFVNAAVLSLMSAVVTGCRFRPQRSPST